MKNKTKIIILTILAIGLVIGGIFWWKIENKQYAAYGLWRGRNDNGQCIYIKIEKDLISQAIEDKEFQFEKIKVKKATIETKDKTFNWRIWQCEGVNWLSIDDGVNEMSFEPISEKELPENEN